MPVDQKKLLDKLSNNMHNIPVKLCKKYVIRLHNKEEKNEKKIDDGLCWHGTCSINGGMWKFWK